MNWVTMADLMPQIRADYEAGLDLSAIQAERERQALENWEASAEPWQDGDAA